MTAFLIALGAALALAFLRLAATSFEAAYYFARGRQFRKAFACIARGLTFVALLAMFIRPAVVFFDSFEVISIDEPAPMVAPERSTDLRV